MNTQWSISNWFKWLYRSHIPPRRNVHLVRKHIYTIHSIHTWLHESQSPDFYRLPRDHTSSPISSITTMPLHSSLDRSPLPWWTTRGHPSCHLVSLISWGTHILSTIRAEIHFIGGVLPLDTTVQPDALWYYHQLLASRIQFSHSPIVTIRLSNLHVAVFPSHSGLLEAIISGISISRSFIVSGFFLHTLHMAVQSSLIPVLTNL